MFTSKWCKQIVNVRFIKIVGAIIKMQILNEVKELSIEWDLSMKDTMLEMLCQFYESAGFEWETIKEEFLSLNEDELLNRLREIEAEE